MRTIGMFLLFISTFAQLFAEPAFGSIGPAVPLVRLIALPERFNDKAISTIGIVRISRDKGGPVMRLYADKDFARLETFYDFVFIDMPLESDFFITNELDELNFRFVRVEGKFRNTSETEDSINPPFRNVGTIHTVTKFQLIDEIE